MTSKTHGADFRRALGVIPPFAVAGALSTLPFVLQADDMADAMWRLGRRRRSRRGWSAG